MDYPLKSLGPALSVLALILLFAMAAVAAVVAVYLAMAPGRIAKRRGHPQADAVNLLGWLGLPTGVLWVAAIVWAYWRPAGAGVGASGPTPPGVAALRREIERLESVIAALEQARGEVAR
jgi:hypothetical protein